MRADQGAPGFCEWGGQGRNEATALGVRALAVMGAGEGARSLYRNKWRAGISLIPAHGGGSWAAPAEEMGKL